MKAIFPKSIRWQIQVWHGFLLICIVGALIVGFYHYERHSRFKEVDTQLHQAITPLLPMLTQPGPGSGRGGPPEGGPRHRPPPHEIDDAFDQPPPRGPGPRPGPGPGGPPDGRAFAEMESAGIYIIVWNNSGQITFVSSNAPANIPMPQGGERHRGNPLRSRDTYRELNHYVPNGHLVLLGYSTAQINKDLNQLAIWLAAAGLAVIAVGFAGGWFMAGRAIRPIEQISSTAERIATGNLSERIPIAEAENELGQLGTVLNSTFDKLEQNFEQQVRFTADASHELRTPISVILTQIQLALSRERTPQEYQQTLQTCERAAERMRTLVNQLLELARVDSGEFELVREECDLGRIARESLEFIEPLAEQKKIQLSHELDSVRTSVDTARLGQVLTNLLNNAIQHNPEGIEICLSLQRKRDKAVFRISDNGVGIPAESMPHLFERFYRVDKSRNRSKGNSGLGLAICKAIIEAHNGTIRVESTPGAGTTFWIELPVQSSKTATATLIKIPNDKTGLSS